MTEENMAFGHERALGKVLVLMAWADGILHKEEKKVLDALLRKFSVTERDQAMFRLYMEFPLTDSEVDAVIAEFSNACKDAQAKSSSIDLITRLVKADGDVDKRERALFNRINEELSKSSGVFSRLKGLGKGQKIDPPKRESDLDKYLDNPVLYLLRRNASKLEIQEVGNLEELEYLSSFGAIIAAIIQADDDISADEAVALTNALSEHWHISPAAASDIAGVILGHYVTKEELTHYCSTFVETHEEEDVLKLFSLLLDVIKADGRVQMAENRMLMYIADQLGMDPDYVKENIAAVTPRLLKLRRK